MGKSPRKESPGKEEASAISELVTRSRSAVINASRRHAQRLPGRERYAWAGGKAECEVTDMVSVLYAHGVTPIHNAAWEPLTSAAVHTHPSRNHHTLHAGVLRPVGRTAACFHQGGILLPGYAVT